MLYIIDILYILDEFFFISLFLFWHVLNNISWILKFDYCVSSHLNLLLCSLFWIWLYRKWDLIYDIPFIISFIKLIPLVLWKRFLCYQGTLHLSLICLIPWTYMSCFNIFSCLITSCYALITSLILGLSGMHVGCIVGHFLYSTCSTNPIILWKHFGLQLRYVPFLFLYAWFHSICMFCVSNILLSFFYGHFLPYSCFLVSIIYKSIVIITSTWLLKTFI